MTQELYDLMDWADVEEVTYAESTEPKRILGPHLLEEGLLIQAYIPTAAEITAVVEGKDYPMELADESGFFAVLIPKKKKWEKTMPAYSFRVVYDNGSVLETEDPYSFASVYSEDDLKKFRAGIHYEIYRKMGAHVCTLDGAEGVLFSVWAPRAMRVSVVGDFNLWDGRRHMMQRIGDSGIFELFIPRLQEDVVYKYEIKCRGREPFLKTDPYGFGYELRPGNACVIRDVEDFNWTDEKWIAERECASYKELPLSVVEVHLGSVFRKAPIFEEDGSLVNGSEFYNYRELAEKLAQYALKEGYTHVELMPIMEYPFDMTWGYQVSGYYAPTSRYGSAQDFQYFVNYLHNKGIGVIMDWVPTCFNRDVWGLAQFDGAPLYENPDPVRASYPHWDALTFDYARPEVSNFLIANVFYWTEIYHIDGIRMGQLASILYLDYGRQGADSPRNMFGGNENLEAVEFLKHLNSCFKRSHPSVLLIAEESGSWPDVTTNVNDGGLGFDLKWNTGWMNDFLSYMQTDPFYRKNNYRQLSFPMVYNYTEDYQLIFSHDEVVNGKRSLLSKMPGQTFEEKAQNLRAAYGFFWTHPGKKLMFMSQDFAQNDEWGEGREIEWRLLEYPVHKGVYQFVSDMNDVYRKNPALWQLDFYPDGFEWINCTYKDLSLLMFIRKTDRPEDTLLVVCNFDNISHGKFRVGVPFPCNARALISSDDRKYGGTGIVRRIDHKTKKMDWDEREYSVEVHIPAMSVTVYKLTPLDSEEEKDAKSVKEAKIKGSKSKGNKDKKVVKGKDNKDNKEVRGKGSRDNKGSIDNKEAKEGRVEIPSIDEAITSALSLSSADFEVDPKKTKTEAEDGNGSANMLKSVSKIIKDTDDKAENPYPASKSLSLEDASGSGVAKGNLSSHSKASKTTQGIGMRRKG